MEKLKVAYDELEELVDKCRNDLDELNEAIDVIEDVVSNVSEQTSPQTITNLGEALKELKDSLKDFSTENINVTIDTIQSGAESFNDGDIEKSTDIKKMGES